MPTAIALIKPSGPLRFGAHPEDLSAVHAFPAADTLFGALVWAVSATQGEAAASAWVNRWVNGNPPFLLSSALPYLVRGDGGAICVPLPNRRPSADAVPTDDRRVKDFKRAGYVEASFLAAMSRDDYEISAGIVTRKRPAPQGKPRRDFAAPGRAATETYGRLLRPGVRIDRASSASEPFSSGATSYSGECRLGVCIYSDSAEEIDRAFALFEVLGKAGIGGGRSRGLGQFQLERAGIPIPVTPGSRGMLLSPVILGTEAMSAALAPRPGHGYRIIERRSWIASPVWNGERARSVNMVAEGSYLSPGMNGPVGTMADITPAQADGRHRIFRYGYGLFLDEACL